MDNIYHKGIVYLPMEVATEPIMFWYDKTKDSVEIYSDEDFIFGHPTEELTYTMEEIKEMNVSDFIIK
jgi:hypothetical protein